MAQREEKNLLFFILRKDKPIVIDICHKQTIIEKENEMRFKEEYNAKTTKVQKGLPLSGNTCFHTGG